MTIYSIDNFISNSEGTWVEFLDDSAGTILASSAVVLGDSQVLVVWAQEIDADTSVEIRQGYAPDIETFLSSPTAVVYDKTLVTVNEGSANGNGANASISIGPDGDIYMGIWGRSDDNDFHADFDAFPDSYGSFLYKTSDDGNTWQWVANFLVGYDKLGWAYGFGSPNMPSEIYEVPLGVPNAGRWIMTNHWGSSYFGAFRAGNAIHTSDDGGITWVLRESYANVYGGGFNTGIAHYPGDDNLYVHVQGPGVSGRKTYLMYSDDGGTSWNTYQEISASSPAPQLFNGGPWATRENGDVMWMFSASNGQVWEASKTLPLASEWEMVRDYDATTILNTNLNIFAPDSYVIMMAGSSYMSINVAEAPGEEVVGTECVHEFPYMRRFEDISDDGNEAAIRRGKRVPEGDVNLAWIKGPTLTPKNNMVIIDTSQTTPENVFDQVQTSKLYYANHLGILEDKDGNQVIENEFPDVTDVFSVEENNSPHAGDSNNEYLDSYILPYKHTSRYFHADFPGLSVGTIERSLVSDRVKVIDESGRDYVDTDGKKRYKITIVPAVSNISADTDTSAYRVFVYIDSQIEENLYLTYNKVELDVDGIIKNQDVGYKEILNPTSFFQYIPEESDVVDPANRDKKWYSSKLISTSSQILGSNNNDVDGYKVYVPRKAIADPRHFQLFRWRAGCKFTEQIQVDPSQYNRKIRAGVIVTNQMPTSRHPYPFYNMSISEFNATNVKFINPLNESSTGITLRTATGDTLAGTRARAHAEYWYVNFDTVTEEELKHFDILVWAPPGNITIPKYRGKIRYFTETLGGTLIIELMNKYYINGLGIEVTNPVAANTGNELQTTGTTGRVFGRSIVPAHIDDQFFQGLDHLGGWNLEEGDGEEFDTISEYKYGPQGGEAYYTDTCKLNYFRNFDEDVWDWVLKAENVTTGDMKPVMVRRPYRDVGGNIFISTYSFISSVNELLHHVSLNRVSFNNGPQIYSYDDPDPHYIDYVNNNALEGAYKFFFNICLFAVRGRLIDDSDETTYSTTYNVYSPWQASWVVNGEVLDPQELTDNQYTHQPIDLTDPTMVWMRKLSEKPIKQLIDERITESGFPITAGATREYSIETTNPLVETPTTLTDDSRVYAWTTAYSPSFTVPPDMGPYVIRDDQVQTGYESGQYLEKAYPPKPYNINVQANYTQTEDHLIDQTTTISVSGTATVTTSEFTPVVTTITRLNWADHGAQVVDTSGRTFDYKSPQPQGLTTWGTQNYYGTAYQNGNMCWPHYGLWLRLQRGSSGEAVTWVQDVLNNLMAFGVFAYGRLAVDGNYGPLTEGAVTAFQDSRNARYVDGIVDAETFSLLGYQILRFRSLLPKGQPGWKRFYDWPSIYMNPSNISDGDNSHGYMKRSHIVGGPFFIWDQFAVRFPDTYNIHGIAVVPWMPAATKYLTITNLHVHQSLSDSPNSVYNYMQGWDPKDSRIPNLNMLAWDNSEKYIPVGPWRGNTVVVGVGSSTNTGYSTSRMIGVKDIAAYSVSTVGGLSKTAKRTINISYQKTITVSTNQKVTVRPTVDYNGSGVLSNIRWTDVSSTNPRMEVNFYEWPKNGRVEVTHSLGSISNTGTVTQTSNFPGETMQRSNRPLTYSMDEFGNVSANPETGFISKKDGLKLLCTKEGYPALIPRVPTGVGANDYERHYVTFTVSSHSSDPSLRLGFYDIKKQEWIQNQFEQAEIAYLELAHRGQDNVFVAMMCDYEVDVLTPLPSAEDAPIIPFKWAMPVYGVASNTKSRIGIEPLPPDLGPTDLWAVPISTGRFVRSLIIPEVPLSNWEQGYRGKLVKAFYSVPEAELGGFSAIYGRPYYDIRNEHPMVLNENVIKVLQPPILLWQEPISTPGAADPTRPIIDIYTKEFPSSTEWTQVAKDDILDWNTSDGTIILRNPLASVDPELIYVDYTTSRKNYLFKQFGGEILNLNPYPGHNRNLIEKPIYIYVLPQYVKDMTTKLVIPDSVLTRTLRFTTDSSIFNVYSPNWDPLAVQLGVIYISTALNIDDLVILDSRRRGGGIKDSANAQEIKRLVNDSMSYWDVGYGAGMSYQRGGFVIVRLPVELKDYFPNVNDVIEVIERNITAGVRFKIEDLEGNEW